MVKELSPAGKIVWKVAAIVQIVMGFTMGLYLFTYGPLFYEKFSAVVDTKLAMTLTTLLFGLGMGLEVLLEVPTGAIGDAIGRKKTVIWSLFFRVLFFIATACVSIVSTSFPSILIFSLASFILFAFSYTFFSGTFTAWGVDSLRKTDPHIGFEHLLSNSHMYKFISVVFGGVLGVIFYLYAIPHVGFLLAAGVCAACIVFCLGEMEDDGVSGQINISDKLKIEFITKRVGEIIGVGFQVFRKSNVILSLVVMFATYMFVRNIVDYLWPVYLRSTVSIDHQGASWILLVILAYTSSSIGAKAFKFWVGKNGYKTGVRKMSNESLRNWMITACFISSIPVMALSWLTYQGLADPFWHLAIAIFPVFLSLGVIDPCFETLVNNYIPTEHAQERATVLSFANLLRSLLVLLLAVPSGGTSGEMTTVGWAIPATLLLTSTIVGGHLLRRAQEKHKLQTATQLEPAESRVENS